MTLRLYLLAASGIGFAASVAYYLGAHRKTADERERARRMKISAIGRITDGTVLDVHEMQDDSRGPRQFVVYNYGVAGVQYECSQDVTHLRQLINPDSFGLGLPASVKYDPHNPGNSIVTAENWSGLRK